MEDDPRLFTKQVLSLLSHTGIAILDLRLAILDLDATRNWSSIRVTLPVFLFGRQACVYQHLCSDWSPVQDLHLRLRFCKPPPALLG